MAFQSTTSCPLCGTEAYTSLLSRPYSEPPVSDFVASYYQERVPETLLAGVDYILARCGGCRFVWQVHRLDEQHAALLYSQWIDPRSSLESKLHADISLYSGYCRQIELIPRLTLKPPQETRVLDFGMGWGRWCQTARALGFDALGVEWSETRIAFARESGVRAVRTLSELGDLEFDFINAEQVFEHLTDPLATLRDLVRHLSERGTIRISVPNSRRDLRRLDNPGWAPTKSSLQPLEHINCFTHRTLTFLGRQAGLAARRQPFLPGQGLLGKSFRRGLVPLAKSLVGVPYRAMLGTTLWFSRASQPMTS